MVNKVQINKVDNEIMLLEPVILSSLSFKKQTNVLSENSSF